MTMSDISEDKKMQQGVSTENLPDMMNNFRVILNIYVSNVHCFKVKILVSVLFYLPEKLEMGQ